MNEQTIQLEIELSVVLRNTQTKVVGLFKPRFSDIWECVIENDKGSLTCIHVGNLLGMSTLHIQASSGILRMFPEKKTLSQMTDDPIFFQQWYKLNCES